MKIKISHLILGFIILLSIGVSTYYGIKTDGQLREKKEWKERENLLNGLSSELQILAKKIQLAQGDSKCESDSQCRTLGLGERSCGEYKDFLVYSTLDANESLLLALVSEFNQEYKKIAKISLTASACGTKPAKILCIEHECKPELP